MMHAPSHPGDIIRDEVLGPLSLDVTGAAEALGVARPTLSKLLNKRASLTPEMALRIEKAFGPKADHLMRMQLNFDMASARQKAGEIDVQPYHAAPA